MFAIGESEPVDGSSGELVRHSVVWLGDDLVGSRPSECGWEDDPTQRADPKYRGGANRQSLRDAQSSYASWRCSNAAEPSGLGFRAPDESRDLERMPLERALERAFRLSRDGSFLSAPDAADVVVAPGWRVEGLRAQGLVELATVRDVRRRIQAGVAQAPGSERSTIVASVAEELRRQMGSPGSGPRR